MRVPSALLALSVLAAPLLAPPAVHAEEAKLPLPVVNEDLAYTPKTVEVLGARMSYLETGRGAPVLFVHGNPSSSYLWRNVLPHVAETNRAIAVDLIGMGGSAKPDIPYGFADHARYLEAFIDAMGLERLTLVGHDWGAALSWNYAMTHPERVEKLAFFEGVVPPAFPVPSFEAMGEELGNTFRGFKDPQRGHQMVIVDNIFVKDLLPALVNRPLGEKARAAYLAPYPTEASRAPVLAWPRQVPIAGEPQEVIAMLSHMEAFMDKTEMPVLFLYAEPGVLLPPQTVPWFEEHIANLETAFIGQGLHYLQEDQPVAIGRALHDWLRRH